MEAGYFLELWSHNILPFFIFMKIGLFLRKLSMRKRADNLKVLQSPAQTFDLTVTF